MCTRGSYTPVLGLNPDNGVEITNTPSESVLPFPAQTLIHLVCFGNPLSNPEVQSTDLLTSFALTGDHAVHQRTEEVPCVGISEIPSAGIAVMFEFHTRGCGIPIPDVLRVRFFMTISSLNISLLQPLVHFLS